MADQSHDSSVPMQIRVVESASDWKKFFKFRRWLYRRDAASVEPLPSMDRVKLDAARNPYFEHAIAESWICQRDGRVVGRISAIVDELHNQHNEDTVGFFGFFECIDDEEVALRLIETASTWLEGQGMTSIRGPVSPSMKGEFGVVVQGNDRSPTVMTNHSFEYYDRLLRSAGLSKARDFFAFEFDSSDTHSDEKFSKVLEFEKRVHQRFPELHIEQVTSANFEQSVREVNLLANDVRKYGWGFVPMTMAEVGMMVKNVRSVVRFDMFLLAKYKGQLVGFILVIPDINWALKRTFFRSEWLRKIQLLVLLRFIPRGRVIMLGVDERFRSRGVAMLLMNRIIRNRRSFREWEFSWVDEENVRSLRAIERSVNLDKSRTWRVYEKSFE